MSYRSPYGPFGTKTICNECGVRVEGETAQSDHDRWHMEIATAVLMADADALRQR